mmetsp:Transcript_30283/g.73719  ORF Transcript_30283/g.73719 Transcript_30283/m.73719 type:complete len:297 (+) Transcript_30283:185-1075(+)|eukprot:CAMPEP_0114522884 /NCGR_PEP_ID=MMETSP0109-20121206/20987_1 /TAXON_ID=29199 /ORGANISM="Chlorarachnion reptans, Strain CCCM449" /LENGTH=296 /DNA_ID=CAMNT_0001704145 /DNA_START=98 /DNA_END=988 /DNA_ORIENTATION=-
MQGKEAEVSTKTALKAKGKKVKMKTKRAEDETLKRKRSEVNIPAKVTEGDEEAKDAPVDNANAGPSTKSKKKKRKNHVVLYVGNLDPSITEKKLQAHFKHCGYILNISAKHDNARSGYAHITIKKNKGVHGDTEQLALELDESEIDGRKIKVRITADLKEKNREKLEQKKKGQSIKEQQKDKPLQPERSKKMENALRYLESWDSDRKSWKFRKVSQSYLLENCYDRSVLQKKHFRIFIRYIEDLKGICSDRMRTEAREIIKEWEESDVSAFPKEERRHKKLRYNRALKISEALVRD